MRLGPDESRKRMAGARVARLATADVSGRPHVVPITFAVDGDRIVFAVDQKPKSTTNLRRLRNIAENPSVGVLADHYDDDWTRLWWVRADGRAAVLAEGNDRDAALERLAAKYAQYRAEPPAGPVVAIDVTAWTGWSYG